ncbi:hypothetical protein ACFLYU_00090 [Candidatus Dependentiae bacterium]
MRKIICVKLLVAFAINLLAVPFTYSGRGHRYYHNKWSKSRFFKKDKQSLKNRKVTHKRRKEKKINHKKKNKIDQRNFVRTKFSKFLKTDCLKGLLFLSLLPGFNFAKKPQLPTMFCRHKIMPLWEPQGIFWLKQCCKYSYITHKFLYCIRYDPDFCPPNCMRGYWCPKYLPGHIQNCINGTKVCSIFDCHKCYYGKDATGDYNKTTQRYENIDYSKCTPKSKLSQNRTRYSYSYCSYKDSAMDCFIKQDITSLKWPSGLTTGLAITVLLAIILLQAQICCLTITRAKPTKYKLELPDLEIPNSSSDSNGSSESTN